MKIESGTMVLRLNHLTALFSLYWSPYCHSLVYFWWSDKLKRVRSGQVFGSNAIVWVDRTPAEFVINVRVGSPLLAYYGDSAG
jgi:hypothetical protein